MTDRPAWREPMVWITAGLPAASVVAGVMLLVTAIRTGGADEVDAPVQRRAQIQVAELAPDEAARRLQVSALVRIGPDRIEAFAVSGPLPHDRPLVLTLSHPVDAAQDRRVVLDPAGAGWQARTALPTSHDWLLRLAPEDGHWRVVGRMIRGSATRLGPALD
jgi:uncharacterized protein